MKRMKPQKGRVILYFCLLVAVSCVMILLRFCDNKKIYARNEEGNSCGDTIDVAIVYSPMNYYMYEDTLGGFNYDLLRLISERYGVIVRYWPIVSLQASIEKLRSGSYDILVSLPIDNALKRDFRYTSDVGLDRQVLVQRRCDDGTLDIVSSLDLANKEVHIEADSPVGFRMKNLMREIGDSIYIIEHKNLSSEYLFLKVASGEFDYAVVNERIVEPLLTAYPNISIDTPISFTQFQAWLVNKEDTILLSKLNQWISEIKKDAAYGLLKARYENKNIIN